ncbi:MAG TPA: hypothetical protein VMZ91_04185 [Candidatus Paceibacterota bacterium]|nr:hypothetical protein [Candidatus Paceibacterota bacterium]
MGNEGVTKMVESKEYEILKYLTQYLTITEIAKQRKCSRTAIYKGIYKLIDKGYLRKIGKAYGVTDRGLHYLNRFSPGKIRLHNLAFKLTILNKPNGWDTQRNKIVDCRASSKAVGLCNNQYEIHSFSNIKVKTTNNSVIFYMPAYYGKNTDECFRQALDTLWNIIPKIENLFKINLIKERKCNIEIISQHYSKLKDTIAKIYRVEDNKLYVKDDEGNIRIIADFSFRVDELEAIYNKTAKEDMDVMQNFIKDLLNNPATITQVLSAIGQNTANQMIYAKNQETHIGLYKGLTREIKGLGKAISKVIKENKDLKLKVKHQRTLSDF